MEEKGHEKDERYKVMDDEEKPRQYRKGGDFYHEEGKGFKIMDVCGANFNFSIRASNAPGARASPRTNCHLQRKNGSSKGF